jgi:hypothetical protein
VASSCRTAGTRQDRDDATIRRFSGDAGDTSPVATPRRLLGAPPRDRRCRGPRHLARRVLARRRLGACCSTAPSPRCSPRQDGARRSTTAGSSSRSGTGGAHSRTSRRPGRGPSRVTARPITASTRIVRRAGRSAARHGARRRVRVPATDRRRARALRSTRSPATAGSARVANRTSGRYRCGRRTNAWLKLKSPAIERDRRRVAVALRWAA